jgi:TRAP-type C4-dicarboxylate transport system substrate-binding protein
MKSLTKLFSAGLAMAFLAGVAEARTLRVGHGTTETNPRHVAAQFFAKRVDELSKGKLKIAIGGNAQFGDDVEMLTALRLGTLDMSSTRRGHWPTSCLRSGRCHCHSCSRTRRQPGRFLTVPWAMN